MRGRLIVIEGIDGAGTTTQTRLLVDWMNAHGLPALATREPSDGPLGRLLREILGGAHAPVAGATMALLFAADRMDHLSREIEPALSRGQHVVTDRYYHSSLAYQAEEADREFVAAINARARRPDLSVLLRVDAGEAARRRHAAGRTTERYDNLALQERIAKNYDEIPGMTLIDGSESVDKVQESLRRLVEKTCV
jgi:dTMP kinase